MLDAFGAFLVRAAQVPQVLAALPSSEVLVIVNLPQLECLYSLQVQQQ